MCGKGGACVVKGGGMRGEGGAYVVCTPPPHEIRPVIARAVRILLECIFVTLNVGVSF